MKISLTDKQIEVIDRALGLNFLDNDLDELKDDEWLYKDYKECRIYAQQIMNKINKKRRKNENKQT